MTTESNVNYLSVGDTYKTLEKFAQLDREIFLRLQFLGYTPQLIFDVGASDGSWSKDISEVLPQAEFYLFEPLIAHVPAYRAIMEDNLRQHANFHLYQLALGEIEEEVTVNVFPHFVASSILNTDSGIETKPVRVQMNTIDNLVAMKQLPLPQVIKIDTQGYELAVLTGAIQTLPHVDILLLECWLYRGYGPKTPLFNEIVNWLRQFNFRLWDIGDTYRGENQVLASIDCLFINEQSGITPRWYYAE